MLIVNADDFGISEGVNRGIVEAHRHGIVTSATVMANMPALEHAAQLARENPGLGIGLHLVLTEGAPTLPPSRVPSLTRNDGRFLPLREFLKMLSLGRLDAVEIEAELSAQVERALTAGLSLTHVDSHHHVHLHPGLQPLVVGLAVRHGLGGIRCPVELGMWETISLSWMLAGGPRTCYLKAVVLSLLGRQLRGRARRAGLAFPDHFRGVLLGWAFSRAGILALLQRLPAGCTELMCHPGHPDRALERQTSYSTGRDRELEALLDPAVRDLLAGTGIFLGNYSALSR